MPAAAARPAASSSAAPTEVAAAAKGMLGSTLVTNQTGPAGKVVHRLYVEKAEPFVRAAVPGVRARPQDRAHPRHRLGAKAAWRSRKSPPAGPRSLLQQQVDPAVGLQAFQARELAFGLGLNIKQVSQAVTTIMGCYRAFRDLDATMVEINPLVVTKDDRVLALDAKMSFDDNAHVPPPEGHGDARRRRGGSARDAGRGVRPQLRRPHRGHRLHHQRRGPRDGDHGHDQARRRRARQFPRCRRRRLARAGGGGVQSGALRPQRQGDPGQHFRRHQPLRLGRAGRGAGGAGPASAAGGAARRHQCRGGQAHHRASAGCPSSRPTRWPRRRAKWSLRRAVAVHDEHSDRRDRPA